jgi:hypothetical protein
MRMLEMLSCVELFVWLQADMEHHFDEHKSDKVNSI